MRSALYNRPSRIVERFPPAHGEEICDFSSVIGFKPDFLAPLKDKRDDIRKSFYSRLCDGFIEHNEDVFRRFHIEVGTYVGRSSILLSLKTNDIIGAFPLKCPLTGQWKHRLIVHPRQGWANFGRVLSAIGLKRTPNLLCDLPQYPYSSRDIPSWVMGSVIVGRIEALFSDLARRFQYTKDCLVAPKGRVDWLEYATVKIPKCKMLEVPCEFSVLQENDKLMGMIRYTLQRLRADLIGLKSEEYIVSDLLRRIEVMLRGVSQYAPMRPEREMLSPLFFGKVTPSMLFSDGLEAIQWAVENRGLAGDADFSGMAWELNVTEFFEAYVESVVAHMAKIAGGVVRSGRDYSSSISIDWADGGRNLQQNLRPDIILERSDEIIIFDAKYKSYWQDLDPYRWKNLEDEERDSLRADILQVLAYSTCFGEKKIRVCLVYPCADNVYQQLRDSNDICRVASVGARGVELVLTVIPMNGNISLAAGNLCEAFAE